MKVFPGEALAFNLGHSYSALQSLTAIFSASHFTSSAPLSSLARISILFISEARTLFSASYGTLHPPRPSLQLPLLGAPLHTRLFNMVGWHERRLSTAILGGPGMSCIPQSEGTRAGVGEKIWVVRLLFSLPLSTFPSAHRPLFSSSTSFRPWPSLSVPLPFLPPSPAFLLLPFCHDWWPWCFAPRQFINFMKRVWAVSSSSTLPLFCFILCFYFHRHCPHTPPTSFF